MTNCREESWLFQVEHRQKVDDNCEDRCFGGLYDSRPGFQPDSTRGDHFCDVVVGDRSVFQPCWAALPRFSKLTFRDATHPSRRRSEG